MAISFNNNMYPIFSERDFFYMRKGYDIFTAPDPGTAGRLIEEYKKDDTHYENRLIAGAFLDMFVREYVPSGLENTLELFEGRNKEFCRFVIDVLNVYISKNTMLLRNLLDVWAADPEKNFGEYFFYDQKIPEWPAEPEDMENEYDSELVTKIWLIAKSRLYPEDSKYQNNIITQENAQFAKLVQEDERKAWNNAQRNNPQGGNQAGRAYRFGCLVTVLVVVGILIVVACYMFYSISVNYPYST